MTAAENAENLKWVRLNETDDAAKCGSCFIRRRKDRDGAYQYSTLPKRGDATYVGSDVCAAVSAALGCDSL